MKLKYLIYSCLKNKNLLFTIILFQITITLFLTGYDENFTIILLTTFLIFVFYVLAFQIELLLEPEPINIQSFSSKVIIREPNSPPNSCVPSNRRLKTTQTHWSKSIYTNHRISSLRSFYPRIIRIFKWLISMERSYSIIRL